MRKLNKNNKLTRIALTLLASFASSQIMAQEAGFFAVVDSRLSYEDNILRESDANADSDTSVVVAPELTIAGILGKQRFSAVYKGEYANYFDFSDVNYTDHDIRLRADFDHSNRLTSRFDVQYQDKHEDFGDLNTIFVNLNEFNHFTDKGLTGRLIYGRQDSFGQLVLRLAHNKRDYDNNNQEFRSNERDLASFAFYYRIAPRTRLLAELVYQDFNYNPEVGFLDLDNKYKVYQAGIEWAFTNQLEGTVKVGYQDRNYSLDTLRDINGLAYEASIDFTPNTYTTINLAARRESIDSSLETAGGFLRTSYGAGVEHSLTQLTKLEAELTYAKDELVFSSNRQDKRTGGKLGITYSLLTWVEVGANYSYEKRDSTQDAADYKANSINLTAKLSFN
ncbi:outer membrane beta-barrel protein [Paraglaciecola sp. 25GB23A]|uniref:outer membrane beta-barrel protein n=1 Tax=Paraglaciecola sp. 25GB23A TaxID=3156068 RepID=UPI0032AFDA25